MKWRTACSSILWVIGAVTLGGCGTGGYTPPPSPQVTLSVAPSNPNVAAGGQLQFTATVTGASNVTLIWEVNSIPGGSSSDGTITDNGLYTAPRAAGQPVIAVVAPPYQGGYAEAKVTVLPPHPVAVRSASTYAEFYEPETTKSFVPRGNQYIRLANLTEPDGSQILGHSTFNAGTYDSGHAESALAAMQSSGYNIVTVTLQGCCQNTIGDPKGGLSSTYMANVVDFLKRAKAHSLAVIFANSWLPSYGGYSELLGPCYPEFGDINLSNLSSCGVKTASKFWQDFAQALIAAGAPMDAIFAYEVWDEYYYLSSAAPLSNTSGMITAANGTTYDMSSQASQQQMMDDGLVYFATQVRSAIQAVDPTALVTISFFQPQGPNATRPGDARIINHVYPPIASSSLDYVDLHAYPVVAGLTLDQYVQNFGFAGYQQDKPILLGEFGAFQYAYPTVTEAATGLHDWQVQSCSYHFQGWDLWTWDTDEQPEIWNAMSQGGVINQALSPVNRPDACMP